MQNNAALVKTPETKATSLQLPEETASLIKASIAENTLKAYQHALHSLETWLSGRALSDPLLTNYITVLPDNGKSPATIGQAVAAVKWQLKHQSQESVNFPITQATLAGIRREGKDRGRGHVQSKRLTTVSARRIIQKRATDAGVDGFISGHSLRVGSAVSLTQGCDCCGYAS